MRCLPGNGVVASPELLLDEGARLRGDDDQLPSLLIIVLVVVLVLGIALVIRQRLLLRAARQKDTCKFRNINIYGTYQ